MPGGHGGEGRVGGPDPLLGASREASVCCRGHDYVCAAGGPCPSGQVRELCPVSSEKVASRNNFTVIDVSGIKFD